MQLSYVLIRAWTSELSLSSPSWYRVKTHRGSRELGCRWLPCFCWPIISWEYPVYFHRPARAKRVSDQDQTGAAAVNETQYVVRSEEMLVDHADSLNRTLSSEHSGTNTSPPHSQLCSYTDAFFKPGRRQNISSTGRSLITAVSDCTDLELLENCVHFSYLCASNLPRGRNTSVQAGLIVCLWH